MVEQRDHNAPNAAPAGTAGSAPAEDPVLDEAVRRLVDVLHPERIYLFGSRARGDASEDSDYDLMVLVRERIGEGREMERRAYHALSDLPMAKDVVVVTTTYFEWIRDAKASLAATVEREGRLLYAA